MTLNDLVSFFKRWQQLVSAYGQDSPMTGAPFWDEEDWDESLLCLIQSKGLSQGPSPTKRVSPGWEMLEYHFPSWMYMIQNIHIFSKGPTDGPASCFPQKCCSGQGREAALSLIACKAQGISFHQSHVAEGTKHPGPPALGCGIRQSTLQQTACLSVPSPTGHHRTETLRHPSMWPGCSKTVLQKHPWEPQKWCPQFCYQPVLLKERTPRCKLWFTWL